VAGGEHRALGAEQRALLLFLHLGRVGRLALLHVLQAALEIGVDHRKHDARVRLPERHQRVAVLLRGELDELLAHLLQVGGRGGDEGQDEGEEQHGGLAVGWRDRAA
jgi:hypothetical protein